MHSMQTRSLTSLSLRAVLFASAATLALYIPYKYATQLHAITGLYAFLFPLSGLLAAAGLILSVKPAKGCDCSLMTRSGLGVLSGLWLATGLMCVGSLNQTLMADPVHGSIATIHMLLQHVLLSLTLIAFAVAPQRMAALFGSAGGSTDDGPGRAVAA